MSGSLILERWADHHSHGCFSTITHDSHTLCIAVERPWVNNAPNLSCIPSGMYRLERTARTDGSVAYALVNHDLHVYRYHGDIPEGVTGARFAILIHPGNWMTDVQGCVAPGDALAMAPDKNGVTRMMVTRSVDTTKRLFKYIQDHDVRHMAVVWKEHMR